MTDPPLPTMVSPAATDPSRISKQARTPPSSPPVHQVTKSLVTRDLDLTIRAFFPNPMAPMKFNPIHVMRQLFIMMLKDELSLVLRTPNNNKQIVLASASIPTSKSEFKKYCKVSTPCSENQNRQHICISCHVLSNRTIGNIKFHSTKGHLLAWLKKQRVFIESDSLGTDRLVTISYFTKTASTLTHLANFREHLINQLLLIDINADTAVKLAPQLKQVHLDAMSNGDDYIPILPDFEIYHTRLSHG